MENANPGAETSVPAENVFDAPVEVDAKPEEVKPAESAPAVVVDPDAKLSESEKTQKRFDKLTAEKYDSFLERDRARYEAEQLRARIAQLEAKPEPVAPAQLPTLESVGYDEAKYQTALLAHAKTVARTEAAALLAEERAATQAKANQSNWETKQAEFAKSKPDYPDKVTNNRSLPITQEMAQVIQGSEVGPQVAYYLAENVEQAHMISRLSPLDQAREIGRIEAKLEALKAAPPPVVSKAPPPPPKIEVAEPAVTKNHEEMSDKEFSTWRKRQIAQRR